MRQKLLALVLATGLMVFGLAATAVADPAPIPVDPNSYAKITKIVERPMGVQLPEDPELRFTFTAAPFAFNGNTNIASVDFPQVNSITFTTEDGILPDVWVDTVPEVWGIRSQERSFSFDLATLSFSQPGVYDYLIEAQNTDYPDVSDSTEQFVLRLTVASGTEGNVITDNAFHSFSGGVVGPAADARYVSIYTPTGGDLTITNEVEGDHADQRKDFNFRVRLTRTMFTPADASVEAVINNAAGERAEIVTVVYDEWFDFELAHGQSMQFEDLPLGTAFMVEELAATDYVSSVAVVINGSTPWTATAGIPDRALSSEAALGQSFLVENRVIGAGENSVTFNNYLPSDPTAHILWDNIGWIIAAGVGFVALLGLIMIIRRRG